MTHDEQLTAWIDVNMPELAHDMAGMGRLERMARLNALTGAGVRSCDTVEDGCQRFLAALQDLTGQP